MDTSTLTSAIITLCVGREQRLFAAHEDVLCNSPWFQAVCRGQFFESGSKRIDLPDDEPEIFSSVLEYLYKGDYYPRLEYDKRRNSYQLEDAANNATRGGIESTVYHNGFGVQILKDTIIYVNLPSPLSPSNPTNAHPHSAPPKNTASTPSSASPYTSRACSPASSAARS